MEWPFTATFCTLRVKLQGQMSLATGILLAVKSMRTGSVLLHAVLGSEGVRKIKGSRFRNVNDKANYRKVSSLVGRERVTEMDSTRS